MRYSNSNSNNKGGSNGCTRSGASDDAFFHQTHHHWPGRHAKLKQVRTLA
jgi:hypothetical protein